MLRSDQWFPRWTPLSIQIEDAVKPSGRSFASLVQLRDAVRRVILAPVSYTHLVMFSRASAARNRATRSEIVRQV